MQKQDKVLQDSFTIGTPGGSGALKFYFDVSKPLTELEEDFQKMWQNFMLHVRKVENRTGWFMPEWSKNLPE